MPDFPSHIYWGDNDTATTPVGFTDDWFTNLTYWGFNSPALRDDDNILQDNDEGVAQFLPDNAGSIYTLIDVYTATFHAGTKTYNVWVAHIDVGGSDFIIMGNVGGGPIAEIEGAAPSGFSGGTFSNVQDIDSTGVTATCFGEGSQITTATGPKNVEDLVVGDLLLTENGNVVPVKWIGRQKMSLHVAGENIQPVRISAGALGEGVPCSDLVVTADHGVVVDGLVIAASALVNHRTIDFVPLNELSATVTYYHVETDNHDVILANGALVETFVDFATRSRFDNYQAYVDTCKTDNVIHVMTRPRITAARLVPPGIRSRLMADADETMDALSSALGI